MGFYLDTYKHGWTSSMRNDPAFAAPITLGAFAKRGVWEEAWRLQPSACPTSRDVRYYLSQADEVAFEIFCGRAFFGLRVSGSVAEVERFALLALDIFTAATNGCSFVARLTEVGYLSASARIHFLEVGAVFAWKSLGTFRLPRPREALATWEDWWPKLLLHPVARDTTYAKTIEFAYKDFVPHWYGIPAATNEYPNLLSESQVRKALEAGENEA